MSASWDNLGRKASQLALARRRGGRRLSCGLPIKEGADKLGGELWDYCVTEGAHLSHATGKPISQDECIGFRRTPPMLSTVPTDTSASDHPKPFPVRDPHLSFCFARRSALRRMFPPFSFAVGVGHPIKPLSPVWRADARSAQIGNPAGILQCLQISAYSGEPFTSKRACNLLSKDACRPALGDKRAKSGPKVSSVGVAFSLSSRRKRLTWTGAGPDGLTVCPSGHAQREAPSADAGEEMALDISAEIRWSDILNAPFVDIAWSDEASLNEIAQPLRGVRVNLVVVGGHGSADLPSYDFVWSGLWPLVSGEDAQHKRLLLAIDLARGAVLVEVRAGTPSQTEAHEGYGCERGNQGCVDHAAASTSPSAR